MKKIPLLILLSLSLTGCFSKDVECGDETAKSIIHDLISDVAKAGLSGEKDAGGVSLFESAKISAYLAKYTSTLSSVRTEKVDPESTKKFCAADIKFSVPADTLSEADKMRKELNLNSMSQLADQLNLKLDANAITAPITYSVQPTDDGKQVFAKVDNPDSMGKWLHELTSSILVKPIVEKRRADAVAAQRQQQLQQASQLNSQACVDSKIQAFRAENGEEMMITHDMLSEWEGQCQGS